LEGSSNPCATFARAKAAARGEGKKFICEHTRALIQSKIIFTIVTNSFCDKCHEWKLILFFLPRCLVPAAGSRTGSGVESDGKLAFNFGNLLLNEITDERR
jgi:hypothetical protein